MLNILLKLLKLPIKLLVLPLIPALMIFHFVCAILLGLSSIITSLLSTVFFLGAVAAWITHSEAALIWQAVGVGAFFQMAPHIASWFLGKVTKLTIYLMGFLSL